ncbi:MAG: Coenzyme F420 hydrogenase/dehydrogenase, beta subunit C-terminal domain [Desulfobacterota bacterium]|nr:Coenzyme F420 hydrogenase/dehydrogenase, beta subunit C-terminal domain [Thermodesulfobacteriota bacterium]
MNTTVKKKKASLPFMHDLCSLCGLCMVQTWPAREGMKICVFHKGWLGELEQDLFGRERIANHDDESRFGISCERCVARLKKPIPGAQFTGIITRLAQRAFETGTVQGVVTLHRSPDDYFFPKPVLAMSSADILAGAGSKPVLASSLTALAEAYRRGLHSILIIGTPCQVHNLRRFQKEYPYIRNTEVYVVGIPCTDNANPARFRWMLRRVSRSHKTARHIEYMQDYTCHITHDDGTIERIPFFSFPRELFGTNVHAPCCLSCFDYMNSLADITVGYIGAPLDRQKMPQWVLVRTMRGQKLFDMIRDELEFFEEVSSGDRRPGILMYAQKIIPRLAQKDSQPIKPGREMSLKKGGEMAALLSASGPRGIEFAKYGVDMHVVRNYYFVKYNYPTILDTLIPRHVRSLLAEYNLQL